MPCRHFKTPSRHQGLVYMLDNKVFLILVTAVLHETDDMLLSCWGGSIAQLCRKLFRTGSHKYSGPDSYVVYLQRIAMTGYSLALSIASFYSIASFCLFEAYLSEAADLFLSDGPIAWDQAHNACEVWRRVCSGLLQ